MKNIVQVLLVLAGIGLIVFLVISMDGLNMGILDPKGIIAIAEKNLLIVTLSLMMLVIIPVFIMLAVFAWRYRATNTRARYTPDWHGNKVLEAIWWTIPTIIVIILAIITWKSTHDLDPYRPLTSDVKPITIQVVALDWKWLFIYPEENIATVNFLEFPKDTPINFKITADAPMNAFWIPQLGGQVYAMAGMTTQLHLMGNEVGSYRGLSSNFSGDGFSGMKFEARVVSSLEYAEWVAMVKKSPYTLTNDRYAELAKKSKNNKVEYYASVEDSLYTAIIMKFMAGMGSDGHPTHDHHENAPSTSTVPVVDHEEFP